MTTTVYMEFVSVFVISLLVAVLNQLHVIIQWVSNKPGEIFTGIPHYFADYFLYVGALAQGAAGRWITAEHLFTNEPMAPTWYYWFYVTIGHIGRLVGLSPFATYNVSLFLLVMLLCLVWYKLVTLLYPETDQGSHSRVRGNPEYKTLTKRLVTWLMILTTTSFFNQGQFWFSPSGVFNRLGGVPYHGFQMILFILLAISVAHELSHGNMLPWLKNKTIDRIGLLVGLVILAALAASANPVQMLVFTAAAGVTTAYRFSRQGFFSWGILAVSAEIGAWATNQEFSRQAVFTAARAWELAQQIPNTLPVLLLSLGPILFCIPFGIRRVFHKKDTLLVLLVVWGLFSFTLFLSPIPRLLGLSPVRFLHPVPYAATLAILGSEGLMVLTGLLHNIMRRRFSFAVIYAGLLGLYLALTIPAVSAQLIDRITPARNPQLLIDTIYNHVPAPIAQALSWLKTHTPDVRSYATPGVDQARTCGICTQVVLTDPAIPVEVLVPVFTGKISFSGHPIHTLYPEVKEALRQEFFGGSMTQDQARRFLSDHRIGYIVTKTPASAIMDRYPFLMKVYQNDSVTIFQISTGLTQ